MNPVLVDVAPAAEAFALADRLRGAVDSFTIGKQLFTADTATGPAPFTTCRDNVWFRCHVLSANVIEGAGPVAVF